MSNKPTLYARPYDGQHLDGTGRHYHQFSHWGKSIVLATTDEAIRDQTLVYAADSHNKTWLYDARHKGNRTLTNVTWQHAPVGSRPDAVAASRRMFDPRKHGRLVLIWDGKEEEIENLR